MQAQTFASLWPILKRASRAHLQGWGEPLLHPRFFDFQALAARAGCMTSTTSSGMAMNEEIAAKLANSGMDIIAFSLAGTDEQSNAARNNVPFAKVCASIRALRQAITESSASQKPEIHLAYLLLANELDALKNLPRLMDELNVDMAVISTLDYLALPQHKDWAFDHNDRDLIARTSELLEKAGRDAEKYGKFIQYALPGEKPVPAGCRENVAKNIYIDADGELSPCVYLNVPGNDPASRRRIFGNANQQNPWELWIGDDFKNFRKKCLSNDPDALCKECPKRREEVKLANSAD